MRAGADVLLHRDRAAVLARAGRVDEAIEVLVPHLRDGRTPAALVAVTAGRGCDERVLELLAPIAEEFRQNPPCGCGPWQVLSEQAGVLERCGRVDEAVDLLAADVAARRYGPQNNVEHYARLLARHGRIDALRDLAGTEPRAAVTVYVRVLEDAGRYDEAIALTEGRSPEFLSENEEFWLRSNRWWLLGEAGRARGAIAEIEALPPGDAAETEERELTVTGLPARDGRTEEAALLRRLPIARAGTRLAELLLRQGHLAEALDAALDAVGRRAGRRRP
ncbi:hypothetical protein [Kitasatospora sp. NPDC057198]|uniref:hypothetical protein n=1 Tax=Kitasatospora sp. NPDC057198 TaxID=3346046 RepID=UPI003627D2C2